MVNLFSSFSKIKPRKVLLVGDLMLDIYTIGKAKRISPEAPVPILHVHHEERRPGGAGNVALNLISLGAHVTFLGRVGSDESGSILKQTLLDEGVGTEGIFIQPNYPTPVKNRVVADNQQIVRIDYEKVVALQEILEDQIIASLPSLVHGVEVIAISDYGKGLITHTLMSAIIDQAHKNNIQVIADPKGMDFTKYRGSHVIKPNLVEVFAAANLPLDAPLESAAQKVLEISEAETLMVTRSEEGISLFHRNGTRQDFSVRQREVKDVTGAGDTVLAVLSCALANGLSISEASRLSNIAAGIAVEHFGCVRVTLSELAQRLLCDNTGNKVFDEEHLNVLREALIRREYIALTIHGEVGLTSALFRGIYQLSQERNWDLLIYVPEGNKHQECISLLASLHDVDYILTEENHFKLLSSWVKPVKTYDLIDGKLVATPNKSV